MIKIRVEIDTFKHPDLCGNIQYCCRFWVGGEYEHRCILFNNLMQDMGRCSQCKKEYRKAKDFTDK